MLTHPSPLVTHAFAAIGLIMHYVGSERGSEHACAITAHLHLTCAFNSILIILGLIWQWFPHSTPLVSHAFAAIDQMMLALVAEHNKLLACAI